MSIIGKIIIAILIIITLAGVAMVIAMWRHDKAVERRVKEFNEQNRTR